LASDLSNIIKDELSNTLEQLLSKKSSIQSTQKTDVNEYNSSQSIQVDVKFEFKNLSSAWKFILPTKTAASFEYFMLGGMGDLKEHIDDEVADAVNEIVSNICGSIATASNAQGYEDLGSVKFEAAGNEIIAGEQLNDIKNIYTFLVDMDDETVPVLIAFDDLILPYIYDISGVESNTNAQASGGEQPSKPAASAKQGKASSGYSDNDQVSSLLSLLGEDSINNLKLLFDIKLKLSVRLGSKTFLLKDILRWDIGEIIELEQMVNEPLEILVNGIKIGEGEAVIVEGKFGLKVKRIGLDAGRLSQIGIGN
jgi:flagellar motor switch protein FliN/FliY